MTIPSLLNKPLSRAPKKRNFIYYIPLGYKNIFFKEKKLKSDK